MNGTITKRALSNGRPAWGYVFDAGRGPDGKRIQLTKSGYETKGGASDALRDAIAEHKAKIGATTETKANPTLAEFFAVWMSDHASRSCAPRTVERYGEIGQYFIRELGQTRINELKTADIQAAIHRLSDCGGKKTNLHPNGRPLAPKTVRHIGTLLYTCLSEADRLGIMTIPHPMANKRVKLPKLIKRKPAVIDSEKLTALFERAKSTRLFPFVVLSASTGCRRGELLALTWSDLNLDTGEMNVSKSLEQTKKGLRVKSTKSGEPREFVVPEFAIDALKAHREQQDGDRAMFGADYHDHGLVFCQPGGDHYSPDRAGARVSELMRKAGLQGVSLHSLRHSCATILLSNHVPLAVVSEQLGHANQNITLSIYSHAIPADKRTAAKVWSNAMADVISANKKLPAERMLENVSAKKAKNLEVIEKIG
jgi:integrase